jgi:hypothetical protein
MKKLKKEGKKEYQRDIKAGVYGEKPLGKPLPNKFLTLLIKYHLNNKK